MVNLRLEHTACQETRRGKKTIATQSLTNGDGPVLCGKKFDNLLWMRGRSLLAWQGTLEKKGQSTSGYDVPQAYEKIDSPSHRLSG